MCLKSASSPRLHPLRGWEGQLEISVRSGSPRRNSSGRSPRFASNRATTAPQPELADSSDRLSKLLEAGRLNVVAVRTKIVCLLLMIRIIRPAEDHHRQRPQLRLLPHPFNDLPTVSGHLVIEQDKVRKRKPRPIRILSLTLEVTERFPGM